MRNDVNRQWLLSNRPQGMIKAENFRWVEAALPDVEDGQVLVRNLWLSFDPTQRPWMSMDTYVPMIPLGEVMRAISVGQVVESHRPDYKPGELVQGAFGWQDYVSTDGSGLVPMRKLPSGVPPNLALSLFGITGPTAYFGVLDVGRVKPGETFVSPGKSPRLWVVKSSVLQAAEPNASGLRTRFGSIALSITAPRMLKLAFPFFAPKASTCFSIMLGGLCLMLSSPD